MGSDGGYYYGFWQADPKLWARCRKLATDQMVSQGWKTYTNKFNQVMRKRALKLWAEATCPAR